MCGWDFSICNSGTMPWANGSVCVTHVGYGTEVPTVIGGSRRMTGILSWVWVSLKTAVLCKHTEEMKVG